MHVNALRHHVSILSSFVLIVVINVLAQHTLNVAPVLFSVDLTLRLFLVLVVTEGHELLLSLGLRALSLFIALNRSL